MNLTEKIAKITESVKKEVRHLTEKQVNALIEEMQKESSEKVKESIKLAIINLKSVGILEKEAHVTFVMIFTGMEEKSFKKLLRKIKEG